jgi:predicted Rossmann fold nucleotide-binding protein DprA/Smf involved in DNA uptake
MLAANQMVQRLQEEQSSLKAALAEQTAAQKRFQEDVTQRNERREAEVKQLIDNINTELSETRVALADAQIRGKVRLFAI